MYSTENLNKKYSYFYGKLKNLKKKRAKARKKGKRDLEEEYNYEIQKIVDLITINKEMFSELSEAKINYMTSSQKEYEKLMDEKENYERMSRVIENISQKEEITDNDIEDLNPNEKVPLRRKIAIGVLGVGIVATLAGGISILHSRKNKNNEPKEPAVTTEEQYQDQEDMEEANSDDMQIDYTEKDGTVVKFDDSEEKESKYTSSDSNDNTTTTNTNSTPDKNDSDNKDENDKKDNKEKNNKDKENKTEDNKNNNNKDSNTENSKDDNKNDTELPGDTEPTITDNTDPIPDHEIENEEVIENDPPVVPGDNDIPIEETPGDSSNDEIYYDENGNEISKEESEQIKQANNEDLIQKYNDIKEELGLIQEYIEKYQVVETIEESQIQTLEMSL